MNGLEYDPSQTGLRAIFKPWQETAIQILQENPQGLNSRETWRKVNQKLGQDTISRASIINFLEAMHATSILTGDEKTGRGGHYLVYKMGMTEAAFKQYLVETLLESLMHSFPEETRQSIQKLDI